MISPKAILIFFSGTICTGVCLSARGMYPSIHLGRGLCGQGSVVGGYVNGDVDRGVWTRDGCGRGRGFVDILV